MTIRQRPDERRQHLLQATARCLADKGAAGVSVRAICAQAGVSSGLLGHYFDGVGDAIAQTYRWTGQCVADALEAAIAAAGPDPHAQLVAYLVASFRPPIASAELLGTWVAFWSLTRSDPAIAAIHAETYADFRQGIERLLALAHPGIANARLAAVGLTALIDGLWLELSLGQAPYTAAEAEALVELWLAALLR